MTLFTWVMLLGYIIFTVVMGVWFLREWNEEYWTPAGFFKARWDSLTQFILGIWLVISFVWFALY